MTLRGVGEFMAVCFIMYVFLIVFSIMMMVQNGKSHFMEKELPRFEQMKENVSEFFKLLSTENLYEPLFAAALFAKHFHCIFCSNV